MLVLSCLTDGATTVRDGDNLVCSFADGGEVEVRGFFSAFNLRETPRFAAGEQVIASEAFLAALGGPALPQSAASSTRGGMAAQGAASPYHIVYRVPNPRSAGTGEERSGFPAPAAIDERAADADGPCVTQTGKRAAEYATGRPAPAAGEGVASPTPGGGSTLPGEGEESPLARSVGYDFLEGMDDIDLDGDCEFIPTIMMDEPLGAAPADTTGDNPALLENGRAVSAAWLPGGSRNPRDVNEAVTFGSFTVETGAEGGVVSLFDADGIEYAFCLDGDGNLEMGSVLPPAIPTELGELSVICLDHGSILYMYELTCVPEGEGSDSATDAIVISVHDTTGGASATTLDIVVTGDAPAAVEARPSCTAGTVILPVDARSLALTVAGTILPLDEECSSSVPGGLDIATSLGVLTVEAVDRGTLHYSYTSRGVWASPSSVGMVMSDSITLKVTGSSGDCLEGSLVITVPECALEAQDGLLEAAGPAWRPGIPDAADLPDHAILDEPPAYLPVQPLPAEALPQPASALVAL